MTDSPALELTKKLIAIESTDPGAFEGAVGDFLERQLAALPDVRLARGEVLPGRSNLMAELPGSSADKPALVFLCHMDTVVAGDGWSLPPFEATERDGRIYGRGACDMKSGLACCLSAFAWAAGKRQAGHLPKTHTLKLICTVDEEDFMRGVEAAVRAGWIGKDDWLLEAEPTGGEIQAAHKGRIWYEIEVTGRTAHASTPWKGADAVAAMAEIIRSIRLAVRELPVHPTLGPSTVTFGQIVGGYRPYVVPDHCRAWVDLRTAPPLDADMADRIVCEAIALAQKEIPGVTASRCVTGNRPSIEMDEASPLLAMLREACRQATGNFPVVGIFPGYTDTAVAAGMLKNHNAMSYGPGRLECAHKPDEWVEIADILRCEQVFRRLAAAFLNRSGV